MRSLYRVTEERHRYVISWLATWYLITNLEYLPWERLFPLLSVGLLLVWSSLITVKAPYLIGKLGHYDILYLMFIFMQNAQEYSDTHVNEKLNSVNLHSL